MESVEASPVEIQDPELTDLAKAMLGTSGPEREPTEVEADPETENQAAEPDTKAADDAGVPETVEAPKNIKALAERLDVEVSELYDIGISMPDGTEMSLGALKDQYQDATELTQKQDELSDRRVKFDTELSSKQAEIEAIAEVIDLSRFTPEEQQNYTAYRQAEHDRETRALLATTPEWADKIQREADHKLMGEFAAKYGMSEGELNGIRSHKVVRIIRDAALKSVKAAKQPPKGQKPKRAPVKSRDNLSTIVADAKSGKKDIRTALGDVLRAQG